MFLYINDKTIDMDLIHELSNTIYLCSQLEIEYERKRLNLCITHLFVLLKAKARDTLI